MFSSRPIEGESRKNSGREIGGKPQNNWGQGILENLFQEMRQKKSWGVEDESNAIEPKFWLWLKFQQLAYELSE